MKTAIACALWQWHQLQHGMLQLERHRSQRWRARMRHAIQHEAEDPFTGIYRCLNNTVPLLQIYINGEHDLLHDYRLSRASLEALILCLGPERRQAWGHHITLLVTVYWLAHGLSYSVVSQASQIPVSTVHRLVHKGVGEISALRLTAITLPAAPELEEIGRQFQQLANSPVFSTCVGAIDGCHIRVKAPPRPSGQDYINRKLFPSIQLQAVCDGKGRFLHTFVGYPGSVHDTRVLKNISIYKEALYPPPGYFIVGDGGYPCIVQPMTIITPYRESLQGRVQGRFNHHHAKARNIVKRAFGMLKVQWRCLLFKALEVDHTFVPAVITACCMLHNICMTAGDIIEATEGVEEVGRSPPPSSQGGTKWPRLARETGKPNLGSSP